MVNDLASFGNAAIHHPVDTAAALGGATLTVASAVGDGLGVALDATGVGAVAGVPINAVSTARVATSVETPSGVKPGLGIASRRQRQGHP